MTPFTVIIINVSGEITIGTGKKVIMTRKEDI